MRIAASISTYGVVPRGAEKTVGLVVDGLQRKGHKVCIFSEGVGKNIVTVRSSRLWKRLLKAYGKMIDNSPLTEILYAKAAIGIHSSYLNNFVFHREVYKRLMREDINYDIMWQHDDALLGKWLRNRFKRSKDIPIVTTDHGGQKSVLVNIKNNPDAIVFHTRSARDKFYNRIKGIQTFVIPAGVDIKAFCNKKACSNLRNYERPIVLSSSALIKEKNINLLIKAMSKVPKGTLVLCGAGDSKDELIALGERLLGNRFVYAGILPYDKLVPIYLACDVFCLTGHEYFSTSMLEAMAANKPIVTWDDPTPRKVIKDAGVLLDLNDIDRFSESIWNVYNSDFENKPREYARAYSIENTISKYEQCFMEVISTKGRG